MDYEHFDTLTRSLAAGTHRRRVLGLLAGTALGGLAGQFALTDIAADRGKKKRRQKRRRRKQQEQCVPNAIPFEPATGSCARDGDCCGTGTCCTFSGEPGQPVASCFDLLSNTTACGRSCETAVNCLNSGQICRNGVCVDPDPE
ncbi:MAG TPA: hypothetical protein VEX37_06035 [Thermomicrobiales bacterium]|nr:hypothetical protein [Thermomicrobiales bacterium]